MRYRAGSLFTPIQVPPHLKLWNPQVRAYATLMSLWQALQNAERTSAPSVLALRFPLVARLGTRAWQGKAKQRREENQRWTRAGCCHGGLLGSSRPHERLAGWLHPDAHRGLDADIPLFRARPRDPARTRAHPPRRTGCAVRSGDPAWVVVRDRSHYRRHATSPGREERGREKGSTKEEATPSRIPARQNRDDGCRCVWLCAGAVETQRISEVVMHNVPEGLLRFSHPPPFEQTGNHLLNNNIVVPFVRDQYCIRYIVHTPQWR